MQGQGNNSNGSTFNASSYNGSPSGESTFDASARVGSTLNAFPGPLYLSYEPSAINLHVHQSNILPVDSSMDGDGFNTVIGWMHGAESCNFTTQTPIQDLVAQDQHLDLNTTPFQQSVLHHSQLTNGLSVLQGESSGCLTGYIHGYPINAHPDTDTTLHLNPLIPCRQETMDTPAHGSSSLNPMVICSGVARYVLKEKENREGSSSSVRHLPLKRAAPEDTYGRQLYVGESSGSAQQTRSSQQEPLTAGTMESLNTSEQLGAALMVCGGAAPYMHHQASNGLGAGERASPGLFQTSNFLGHGESSQRNVRVRTVHQQDFLSTTMSRSNTRNQYVQSPGQPPFHNIQNTNLATAMVHPSQQMQPSMQVPISSEFVQPFHGNGILRSANGASSTFAHGMPVNITCHSRYGFTPNIHQQSSSASFLQGNMAQQYVQRISEIVNRSGSGWHYYPIHAGASAAAARGMESTRASSARHSLVAPRSRLTMRIDRQAGSQSELLSRSLTAAISGSTIRTCVQAAVRSGLSSLSAAERRRALITMEAVAANNADNYTELFGILDDSEYDDSDDDIDEYDDLDDHADMRLDIDDMTYEEILHLEEQMGNVSTGLSEDAVLERINQWKYYSVKGDSPIKEDVCCICQEGYVVGECLANLDCKHSFHFDCIKQWLVQKNSCPICKQKGLSV